MQIMHQKVEIIMEELPQEIMSKVSDTYLSIANKITKNEVSLSDNPKEDILDTLNENFALIK